MNLSQDILELENQVKELLDVNTQLNKEITYLRVENSKLKTDNIQLKEDISELKSKPKKNSQNSSLPPSQDLYSVKPNQSLRRKSGKKTGGQLGHDGSTLSQVESPNYTHDYFPTQKCSCGHKLSQKNAIIEEKRQVFDIPRKIDILSTEHRIHSVVCKCGKKHKASFPKGVNAYASYGNELANLIAYLSVEQYMSYRRIKSYLKNIYNLNISEGTIKNLLRRVSELFTPFYDHIHSEIIKSKVVGSDETGGKMGKEKLWFWVWQNKRLTYIVSANSRGYKVIEETFPGGLPWSVLVTDCWSAQLKTKTEAKQICLSHILRDLNYIKECTSFDWPTEVADIILEAMELKKISQKKSYPLSQKDDLEVRLNKLLQNSHYDSNDNIRKLRKRLLKRFNAIFTFLQYDDVPFDNNGSERAIRNVKVKMKVSTCYRSYGGAQDFAIIKSVYDTIHKQGRNLFDIGKILLEPNSLFAK